MAAERGRVPLIAGLVVTGCAVLAAVRPRAVLGALAVAVVLFVASASRERAKALLQRRTLLVSEVSRSWPLVLMPTAAALSAQSRPASLLLLGALVIWAVGQTPDDHVRWTPPRPFALLLLLGAVSWFRGAPTGLQLTVPLVTAIVVATCRRRAPSVAGVSAVEGIGVYLIVSAGLHAAGVRSPAAGVRLGALESTVGGLFSERTLFPLAYSYVTGPVMAAAFVAALPALWRVRGPFRRRLAAASGLAATYVLLGGNYRASMAVGALIAIAAFATPRGLARLAAPALVVALLVPFWFPSMVEGVNATASRVEAAVSAFDRADRSSALSGREEIWKRALEWHRAEVGGARAAIGYGADGHVTSGVAGYYVDIFRSFLRGQAALAPPHSSALQVLYDSGYVGLLTLLAAGALALQRCVTAAGSGEPVALAVLAAFLALALTGATEVTFAPIAASPEPFFLALALSAALPSRIVPAGRPARAASARQGPVNAAWPHRYEADALLISRDTRIGR